eukprot:6192223-Pleurochrysis_carterae.AAC.2
MGKGRRLAACEEQGNDVSSTRSCQPGAATIVGESCSSGCLVLFRTAPVIVEEQRLLPITYSVVLSDCHYDIPEADATRKHATASYAYALPSRGCKRFCSLLPLKTLHIAVLMAWGVLNNSMY